jgi:hypothetical protein
MAASAPPEIQLTVPSQVHVEDPDIRSRVVTEVVGPLLTIDFSEQDAVAHQLQVRWVAKPGSEHSVQAFLGVDATSGAPFESVEYRRSVSRNVTRWSDVTLKFDPGHCYTGRALVVNYAPDAVATPYTLPDGDEDTVSGRAIFSTGKKDVILTYRRDHSAARCVSEIYIRQPAQSR